MPLGGLGEIGKNMMVYETANDMIVVDSGLMFPEEEMLGVDLVIPDITYIHENAHKLRGIFITHGHEDHTGALPYVMKELQARIGELAGEMTPPLLLMEAVRLTFQTPPTIADPSVLFSQGD